MVKLNWNSLLLILVLASCSNEKNENSHEVTEKQRLDSICSMIKSFSDKKLSFVPSDQIIELPNDAELVMFKNSFLNQNGEIYHDLVNMKYSIRNDKKHLLINQLGNEALSVKNLIYLLQIEILDSKGNPLLFNPDYSTLLRFHPREKLNACTYFYYDSSTNEYATPLYFSENTTDIEHNSDSQELPDIMIGGEYWDTLVEKDHSKINHDKWELTKQEVIGYEMTLKHSGFYYISREDKKQDLQVTNIKVQLLTDRKSTIDWRKGKVFLFTEQKDYNYHLGSTNLGNGRFSINPFHLYSELKLPLDNTYTLLAYAIDGENCYFVKKRGIKLTRDNLIELKFPEVAFEDILNEVRKL